MTVDHEYVKSLLEIAERSGDHSGKLSSLQSWAIGELIRINGEVKADAVEAKKQAEAEHNTKVAEQQDEARKQAETNQKATGLPSQPGVQQEPFEPAEAEHPDLTGGGNPNIYTSDNPNPNLTNRRI